MIKENCRDYCPNCNAGLADIIKTSSSINWDYENSCEYLIYYVSCNKCHCEFTQIYSMTYEHTNYEPEKEETIKE